LTSLLSQIIHSKFCPSCKHCGQINIPFVSIKSSSGQLLHKKATDSEEMLPQLGQLNLRSLFFCIGYLYIKWCRSTRTNLKVQDFDTDLTDAHDLGLVMLNLTTKM